MKKYNKSKEEKKGIKGITLVALVITIIILLILAGISVNLIIQGGILDKAQKTGENYKEQVARERLEIVLGELQTDKYIENSYNRNEYIDNKLSKENMIVVGDIVIVDDWKFEIDRDVPKIGTSLGKGNQNEEIKITAESTIRQDYVNATIKVNIEYEGNITEIIIKGESIQVPEKIEGAYVIEKEVVENGIYTIYAKDEQGNYKIGKIEITEITEDMDIWNKQDMENFRDKVNAGRTFEGRTARVMADIDLGCTQENQWIPIGTGGELVFKGTFEGNAHTISNIYINTNEDYKGLFGYINNSTIKGVTMDNGTIIGNQRVASIVGYVAYSRIIECVNKVTVLGTAYTGGIVGWSNNTEISRCANVGDITSAHSVGGIVGLLQNGAKVFESYNIGSIKTKTTGSINANYLAGGICGYSSISANIVNCYNIGSVYGYRYTGGIIGYSEGAGQHNITNCYSIGKLSGNGVFGISGLVTAGAQVITTNNYWLTGCGASYGRYNNSNSGATPVAGEELKTYANKLGDAYVEDSKNINGGYPVLKWQYENLNV
ncbi:MAG: hypothetical protein HFJ25_05655 [Clostridia bacterium]|nr:hypothetical protein [Clostridia bacterium]